MSVSSVLARLRAFGRRREAVRQLANLSDRQLEDLGLSRYEIRRGRLARQA